MSACNSASVLQPVGGVLDTELVAREALGQLGDHTVASVADSDLVRMFISLHGAHHGRANVVDSVQRPAPLLRDANRQTPMPKGPPYCVGPFRL
jgi:hypothetical protein